MSPAGTLVIPAHNAAVFLERTLHSVAQQDVSSTELEVILVNDASSDDTEDLARRFLARLPFESQLVSLSKQRGPGRARNEAILRAQGRFIMLLDADDELEPAAVSTTLHFLQRNPAVQYCYSRLSLVDEHGELLSRKPGVPTFSRSALLHYNYVSHLKCFTHSLHNEIGGYSEEMHCEDYDHVLRASELLEPAQIAQIPVYLYRYRLHSGNRSQLESVTTRTDAAKAIEASLLRKERMKSCVRYSHRTEHSGGGYAYYSHNLL